MTNDPAATLYEILEKTIEDQDVPDLHDALRKREDLTIEKLELTSLKTVEVLMELHDTLGVDLDMEEVEEAGKISDLVKLIEARL